MAGLHARTHAPDYSRGTSGFGEDAIASLQLGASGFTLLSLPTDGAYNVAAGEMAPTISDNGEESFQVSWSAMPASYIPDPAAAR